MILTQDNIVNAFADGKKIIMTQGIVDYAKDDNELALVIAHELAHNDRGHLDAKKKNTLMKRLQCSLEVISCHNR